MPTEHWPAMMRPFSAFLRTTDTRIQLTQDQWDMLPICFSLAYSFLLALFHHRRLLEWLSAERQPAPIPPLDEFVPFRFLDLPGEIRNRVYMYNCGTEEDHTFSNPKQHPMEKAIAHSLGLTQVCRQICQEYMPIHRSSMVHRVRVEAVGRYVDTFWPEVADSRVDSTVHEKSDYLVRLHVYIPDMARYIHGDLRALLKFCCRGFRVEVRFKFKQDYHASLYGWSCSRWTTSSQTHTQPYCIIYLQGRLSATSPWTSPDKSIPSWRYISAETTTEAV